MVGGHDELGGVAYQPGDEHHRLAARPGDAVQLDDVPAQGDHGVNLAGEAADGDDLTLLKS